MHGWREVVNGDVCRFLLGQGAAVDFGEEP